jgi:hypothetical protein
MTMMHHMRRTFSPRVDCFHSLVVWTETRKSLSLKVCNLGNANSEAGSRCDQNSGRKHAPNTSRSMYVIGSHIFAEELLYVIKLSLQSTSSKSHKFLK